MTDRPPGPAVVELDLFGRFRVGRLVFDTRAEAERAMREIPAPRARKKKAPTISPLRSERLTLRERGVVLRDAEGRVVGGVVKTASGAFALWQGGERRGEFSSREEAEAVARKVKRKGLRPAPLRDVSRSRP